MYVRAGLLSCQAVHLCGPFSVSNRQTLVSQNQSSFTRDVAVVTQQLYDHESTRQAMWVCNFFQQKTTEASSNKDSMSSK